MTKRIFAVFPLAAMALASCAQHSSGLGRSQTMEAANGRALFLKNCAHCHGADAHGGEGPELHQLDWTDEQITSRIRNGKKGQMTAFADKLTADQVSGIKDYLRTLK